MTNEFGYMSPKLTVDYLRKFVPVEASILDAGCGTGLVGQLLHHLGYHRLSAMDLSEDMLAEARKKEVYAKLQQGTLGQPLDFPTNTFNAVISVGVFTVGHAPASGFDELIRITKPSGYIIFTLHSDLYEHGEFPDKFAALETAGQWSLIEVSDKLQPTPIGEPEVTIRVLVYQVEEIRD
ncbi:class I SAM-dependent methyltransferase [Chloroflexi bacterium TSY]|nr:class I SAM-dependent methyltransferase [Chloroflexi bacterium TSY]